MARSRPACDKHPNLQMIPCSLKRTIGPSQGHVCPVPDCSRHHDDEGYFDVVNPRILREESGPQNQHEAVKTAI